MRRRQFSGIVAITLPVVAFLAAAQVSTDVFDRLPHVEDEVTFLFQAKTIASGHVMVAAPPRPEFFPIPFIIARDGQWFGKYPPGYPAVLALGVLIGQPWLINPIIGALSVGLVYLIGRRLYGEAVALLASALMITSPFFLLQAGSFMSHVVSLFWALLTLYLFVAAHDRQVRSILPMALAGVALGMLLLSRPLTAVGIGIPFVIWATVAVLREPRRLVGYLPMLVGFLPCAAALLAYNRLTTGDSLRSAYELWWACDKVGFGPDICANGYTLGEGITNMKFELGRLAAYLFGWPLGLSIVPVTVAAVDAILRTARSSVAGAGTGRDDSDGNLGQAAVSYDLLLMGMVAGLIVIHLGYWHGGPHAVEVYGPRYYFEALGALVLLSSRGLLRIAELSAIPWAMRSRQHARQWTTLATLVIAVGLVIANFSSFAPQEFRRYTHFYGIEGSGVRTVRVAELTNAIVFIASPQKPDYAWPDYAPFFVENDPSLNSDPLYVADLGEARNRTLMALYPDRTYYRYAEGTLTRLTAR